MPRLHLVRFGSLGTIGQFVSPDAMLYPRSSRVIVRTSRGLETGEVLALTAPDEPQTSCDGDLLRRMSVEDELLAARLETRKEEAVLACQQRLAEEGRDAVLIDVEQLFDGRTLVFYFMGPSSGELDALTAELAECYDAQAQVRSFADLLEHGCGPGCGTEAGGGCGTEAGGGCGSCNTGCALSAATRQASR